MSRVKLRSDDTEARAGARHLEKQEKSLEAVISQWVEKQPAWYSDALHITLQGTYTDEQVDALASAACREHGVELGIQSQVALAAYRPADLGSAGDSQRSVLLEFVTAESGINAIERGSRLTVATSGITVVYGNNGSGKSGFSRIMRNSCTSRSGSSEILANVFKENGTPSVTYGAIVDGERKSYKWKSGETDYPTFPEVAFFDADCAAKEINEKDNEILYVPSVISSLMRLPSLVSAVAARIQMREDELTEAVTTALVPQEHRSSERVTALLSCMTAAEAEKLVNDAKFSPQEANRLATLPKLIEADPDVEIPKLERRKAQLITTRIRLVKLYQCCQPMFAEQYKLALDAVRQAEEATKAAAMLASGSSKLDGFGVEAWKNLWEAARSYSNGYAHTNAVFPKLTQASLCPLCQQPLGSDALARMDSFEAYVTGVAEKSLTKRRETLDALTKSFMDAVNAVKSEKGFILALDATQVADKIDLLMRELAAITSIPDMAALAGLSKLIEPVGLYVRAEIDALAQRIEALRESQRPGSASKLRAELSDLSARDWIYANKDTLVEDAKKRELKASLEDVRKKCSTRPVSMLISSASQVEIVEKIQSAFIEERARLNATAQQVAITTRVRSGQECQRITLDGAKEPVRSVLSEGEQKIVALAGFFALLDVLPGNSTVVLDDPITSLDHLWRRAVATRLVEVAESRPVIVFTHEPMFCVEITELAGRHDVPVEYRSIYRKGSSAGVVFDGLDWAASNLKQRIGLLKKEVTETRTHLKAGLFSTDAVLEDELRRLYSKLRSTWECAVETALLDGVVERMKLPVQTQKLKKLVDISKDDVRIVEENMSKCSRLTEAHADPLATPDAPPTIDGLEADIRALDDWVKAVRKRRDAR